MKKAFLIALTLIVFGLSFSTQAHAQTAPQKATVLVYEVREGKEATLQYQKDKSLVDQSAKPVVYLWQIDALKNQDLDKTTKSSATVEGLLLEVSGGLLKSLQISRPQQIIHTSENIETEMLIGYTEAERKKLIDAMMQTFVEQFGYRPKVVGAGFVDSISANYIRDQYGVKYVIMDGEYRNISHSIMDGGPSFVPYAASDKWTLIPDPSNQNPLWILREAKGVFDPTLLDGDMLTLVVGYSNTGKQNINVSLSDVLKEDNIVEIASVPQRHVKPVSFTSYGRGDLTLYEIVTPVYRMQILRNKEKLWIADIRLYSPETKDPYQTKVAAYGGYMVAPYLLNGSGWQDDMQVGVYQSDKISHLELPALPPESVAPLSAYAVGDLAYIVTYKSATGQTITLVFNADQIQMTGFSPAERKLPYKQFGRKDDPVKETKSDLLWKLGEESLFGLFFGCEPKQCLVSFKTDKLAQYSDAYEKQSFYTFPEPRFLTSKTHPTLELEKSSAKVGETMKIRVGNLLPNPHIDVETEPHVKNIAWSKEDIYEPTTLSFTPQTVGATQIKLMYDAQTLATQKSLVIPTCSVSIGQCLVHPSYLWHAFLRMIGK